MTRLPDGLRMGRVRLRVRDLERALEFYRRVLGLRTLPGGDGAEVELSADGAPPALLALRQDRSAPPRPPRTAGLFHFALLVPTRGDLGRFLIHVREQGWPLQGFADHSASEAVYLADPEGNGIEVYADRPRSAWKRRDGRVELPTDPLDLDGVLAAAEPSGPWVGLAGGTRVGHLHLEAADLEATEDFFSRRIGFDLTASYPGARFLAAGGYHHHVAVNSWNRPRGRPPAGSLGLIEYEVMVPPGEARDALIARLGADAARVELTRWRTGFRIEDPSGSGLVITDGDE